MKAPFPYFGGKSTVASDVWPRFGEVNNYVEPFFGSGAMLLNRPNWTPTSGVKETVNDKSGFLANFWRATQADPESVAYYADWPVNEIDLAARHAWLVQQADDLSAAMEGDPDYYDSKIAGWWVWGACCWIGSGWCSGRGPWSRQETPDGWRLVSDAGRGVNRKLVHLGDAGRGVNRKLVHLGDDGRGDAGNGEQGLLAWICALSQRLERVRVCCGDWARVTGPSPTYKHGTTAIFLDPPYTAEANRVADLYEQDNLTVGHTVAAWCKENEDNPLLRIALCGYNGEYDLPGWEMFSWKAAGGFGGQSDGKGKANAKREVIWFSPHCIKLVNVQRSLFEGG